MAGRSFFPGLRDVMFELAARVIYFGKVSKEAPM
jgi:hypothetical protein